MSLNSVNRLIFVTVKSCVFFAVRTELLNIIHVSFGLKGLGKKCSVLKEVAAWTPLLQKTAEWPPGPRLQVRIFSTNFSTPHPHPPSSDNQNVAAATV
jgi:hypothetical protein